MSKNDALKPMLKPITDTPSFLANINESRGSEEVETDDLIIPRLELCQALSPCLKENDPAFIPEIKIGDLYNNVTREIYGGEVIICPVKFKKEYLLWRDRQKDTGGFNGAYGTLMEAEDIRGTLDRPENVEAVDTHQHLCLLIKLNSDIEEIAISMARSKRKPSKAWNSLIRINGGDRFSRLYKVSSVDDKSDKGEYKNFKVTNFGFVTEPIYNAGMELYNAIQQGQVSVDRSLDETDMQNEASREDTY